MKIEMTKKIVALVAGMSASHVVGEAIKNNIVVETTAQKAVVTIGQFGLGMAVASAVSKETDQLIDDVNEAIQTAKNT